MNARFVITLLAPPALLGGLVAGLGFLGSYGANFGMIAGVGLLFALPLWLTVFAWRALGSVREGDGRVGRYVWHGLAAALIGLGFWALVGYVVTATGIAAPPEGMEAVSPLVAGAFAGAASFVYGLFFFPMLAALFALAGRRLSLIPKA